MWKFGERTTLKCEKYASFCGIFIDFLIGSPSRRFKFLSDPRLIKGANVSIDPEVEMVFSGPTGKAILGDHTYLGPRILITPPKNGKFSMGRFSSINADAQLHGEIEIGSYCVIASSIYALRYASF